MPSDIRVEVIDEHSALLFFGRYAILVKDTMHDLRMNNEILRQAVNIATKLLANRCWPTKLEWTTKGWYVLFNVCPVRRLYLVYPDANVYAVKLV